MSTGTAVCPRDLTALPRDRCVEAGRAHRPGRSPGDSPFLKGHSTPADLTSRNHDRGDSAPATINRRTARTDDRPHTTEGHVMQVCQAREKFSSRGTCPRIPFVPTKATSWPLSGISASTRSSLRSTTRAWRASWSSSGRQGFARHRSDGVPRAFAASVDGFGHLTCLTRIHGSGRPSQRDARANSHASWQRTNSIASSFPYGLRRVSTRWATRAAYSAGRMSPRPCSRSL